MRQAAAGGARSASHFQGGTSWVSVGPRGVLRGTPSALCTRYESFAAQADGIEAEALWQHADHWRRLAAALNPSKSSGRG